MNPFSPDEVFLAYKKAKHFFYYDNANLLEKKKIAEFEEELFFNEENICDVDIKIIKHKLSNRISNFIINHFITENSQELLNHRINILKLPKKLRRSKIDIITNKPNINEDFHVERYSYFADFPVEIHILSVLWVMFSGRYLNSCISNSSYANMLDMDFLADDSEPGDNLKLFKPYFVQYQLWRDSAINKAESILDEKRDVTILSLDIKNYYHSIRINLENVFSEIKSSANKNTTQKPNFEKIRIINDYFYIVHNTYKKKCKSDYPEIIEDSILDDEFTLPVGLISSGILANYFLNELDNRILNNINPAFYGRYVDDLMFVFSDINNFVDKDLNSSIITFLNKNFVKKDILKFDVQNQDIKSIYFKDNKYLDYRDCIDSKILKNCVSRLQLENEDMNTFLTKNIKFSIKSKKNEECDKKLQIFNYTNLQIQSSKVVLHYLDHKESKAIINIFKRKLNDQRSEFRFLPDEDEISQKFDEEAFEIRYNDSINKFRSISDFSENKYGASKFLAKMIFAKSFGGQETDEESDYQILTFFRGEISVKFYSLWEKVATYFIVSNRIDYLLKFKQNVCSAILHTVFDIDKNKNLLIARQIEEFLQISLSMPLALNLNIINEVEIRSVEDRLFFDKCILLAKKIRNSNLIRHSLLAIPSSNLTKILLTDLNLLEKNFNNYYLNLDVNSDSNKIFQLCKLLSYLVPYYVQFHDVNTLRLIDVVSNLTEDFSKEKHDKFDYLYSSTFFQNGNNQNTNANLEKVYQMDIINKIPDDSFLLYYFINYSWKRNFSEDHRNRLKDKYFNIQILDDASKLQSLCINIKGNTHNVERLDEIDKNIAIANIKVKKEDMFASIRGMPNVGKDRRKILFNLINEADKNEADLLIFPEVSIPYSWIKLLSERSHKRYMGIVAGLEHWVNKNNIVFNFLITILPFKLNYYNTSIIKLRLKNHYSHSEKHLIKGYRLLIPSESNNNFNVSYDLFHWRKTYFSVYNCFELADIYHRSLFKSKVDFIIASEYNRDTNYFSDIAGAWVRDVHSYFVQVNSSDFGDSRIIQPSKSVEKDLVQVKGGNNSVILVSNLNIKKLRNFQYKEYHLQKDDIDKGITNLKPTPPDFDRDNVKIRIQNKDFK